MKKSVKFSPEVRGRAVRMVTECRGDHPSQWAAVESVAAKIGCIPLMLTWVRQHERDTRRARRCVTFLHQPDGYEPLQSDTGWHVIESGRPISFVSAP